MTRQRKTTVEAAQVEEPELPEPTKAETESALTVHSRFDERRRLARIKLKSHDDGSFSFGPPHSSAAIWAIQVADAMGTGSVAFGQQQVHHLVRIALAEPAKAESVANSMLAMVQCVDAEDEMVAQLAVQMAATHQTAMQALGRAAQAKEVDAIDALGNLANKLMRTYTMQAEALAKMRRGGEQKVKVEHVHVYEGGQAIVGNVTHPPGGERKNESRPHAPTEPRALTFAPVAPVLCPDPQGDGLPVASSQRKDAVPDARGRQGKRRAEG
ncbi:hypothetical protein MKK75_21835 [Methylobacterium sp. J-030]|uniref:hypothetical protein n=1 Tax=Methylobacterium sp. J-030 TaxID=2836627 RepID=UPI001FB95E91|nr:hypothetical protein [Methylobacterium sp. J-030]MCJ2071404.1 hypothetical protein [Methylobacterium sp. J-030]